MNDPRAQVLAYHQSTKHHFHAYAHGPGYLDWANQPDFFRRYRGAPTIKLEKAPPSEDPLFEGDLHPGHVLIAPLNHHRLVPGQMVVELTSGNTGTGLAIVCGVKRYPFVAVMSKGNSMERTRMMAALGAEVVLVDQTPDSKPGQVSGSDLELVERETQRIVEERNAFRADQFQLESNFRAHYLHTGSEIIRQSAGTIQAFCDFAGTGGSFAGCAAALKEHDPSILCYLVEPEGTAVLAGEPVTDPQPPHPGRRLFYARPSPAQTRAHRRLRQSDR